MKLILRDFSNIEHADVELSSQLTLVAGHNAAGKTSIATALHFLLAGMGKMTRMEAMSLVRHGATTARLRLESEQTFAEISIPSKLDRVVSPAAPPYASAYATGFQSLLKITDNKERAQAFGSYIKAEPTKEDLDVALGEDSSETWGMIDQLGWDTAHKAKTEEGTKLKGHWQQVTGQSFKPAKGGEWVPDGWSEDLAGQTVEGLEEAIDTARTAHEEAVAFKALGDQEKAEYKLKADQKDLASAEIQKAVEDLKAIDDRLKAERATLDRIAEGGPSIMQLSYDCPHCAGKFTIKKEQAVKLDEKMPTKEDVQAHQNKLAAQKTVISILEKEREEIRLTHARANDKFNQARNAEAVLAELGNAPSENPHDVEAFRQAVKAAEQNFVKFKRKEEADQIFNRYKRNQEIVEVLAPGGLRQKKTAEALTEVNAELSSLSVQAGWQQVTISDDLQVSFGQTPYHRLSGAEAWCVRLLFQMWCAPRDGSQMLVIDAADILYSEWREGLFNLLEGTTAVICMTADTAEDVPNLSEHGMGVTVWVDGGRVMEPAAA